MADLRWHCLHCYGQKLAMHSGATHGTLHCDSIHCIVSQESDLTEKALRHCWRRRSPGGATQGDCRLLLQHHHHHILHAPQGFCTRQAFSCVPLLADQHNSCGLIQIMHSLLRTIILWCIPWKHQERGLPYLLQDKLCRPSMPKLHQSGCPWAMILTAAHFFSSTRACLATLASSPCLAAYQIETRYSMSIKIQLETRNSILM